MTTITKTQVPNNKRIKVAADIFGANFPMRLEPFIYALTGNIAEDYSGGYWEFYTLSNGGFYMAPRSDTPFKVSCENGFEGQLSGDALGIAACLYAYSNLSFGVESAFTETCARQYYWLREYMHEHPEVAAILGAID
jgi:hypothetical protein